MLLTAIDSPTLIPSEPRFAHANPDVHIAEKPVTIEDLSLLSQELSELDVPKGSTNPTATSQSFEATKPQLSSTPTEQSKEYFSAIMNKDHVTYPAILPKQNHASDTSLGDASPPLPLPSVSEVSSIFTLELIHEDLWNLFDQNHNEMIITRFGRCLFPSLKFKLSVGPRYRQSISGSSVIQHNGAGSADEPLIAFGLQLIKTSAEKLKFRQGSWIPNHRHGMKFQYGNRFSSDATATSSPTKSGTSTAAPANQVVYWHPSGVQSLSFWAKYGLSFLDAKLANGKKSAPQPAASEKVSAIDKKGPKMPLISPGGEATLINCPLGVLFQLESFYEYTPKVVCKVYSIGESGSRVRHGASPLPIPGSNPSYRPSLSAEFLFSKCSFIAVTHYQNAAINMLKKQYNPHAKGFIPDSSTVSMHHLTEDEQESEDRVDAEENVEQDSDEDEVDGITSGASYDLKKGAGTSYGLKEAGGTSYGLKETGGAYKPSGRIYPAKIPSPSGFESPSQEPQSLHASAYYGAAPIPAGSTYHLSDYQLSNTFRQRQHAYSLPYSAPQNADNVSFNSSNNFPGDRASHPTPTSGTQVRRYPQQLSTGRFSASMDAYLPAELEDTGAAVAAALLASWYTQKQQNK
ncbi:hypothetical protein MDAP_000910 [Mitosporidium daphniae]